MRRRLLDSSVLIRHWRSRQKRRRAQDLEDADDWAKELIPLRRTDAIATPVHIEFVCGITDRKEMELARRYLSHFTVIDGGRILPDDWKSAAESAMRVPRDHRPRQLGDCLIRAIADRMNYDVDTHDLHFPG
jgi:predicted nucleic acid-binding protein